MNRKNVRIFFWRKMLCLVLRMQHFVNADKEMIPEDKRKN